MSQDATSATFVLRNGKTFSLNVQPLVNFFNENCDRDQDEIAGHLQRGIDLIFPTLVKLDPKLVKNFLDASLPLLQGVKIVA